MHPSLALAACALLAAQAEATDGKKKVLVLPYQAIYRSVPQQKLNSATELLYKELEQKGRLEIVRGGIGAEAPKGGPGLEAAQAAAQAAQKAEAERRIAEAIAEWKKAIAAYESNAAAVEPADQFIEAHHRLARALMWSGKDAEAKLAIDVAARMDPGYELPALDYSKLYRRWFVDAAAAAMKERTGQVMVSSALPGAKVFLDGRELEVAPVLLERVIPGKHLIAAVVPEVPRFGAVVQVTAGGKADLRASFAGTMGGSAVGRVTDAIAENAIPQNAVQSAAAAGKEAGAEFVVFGGMAQHEDKFRVHTFLVKVDAAKIQPLEEASFDLEMLTAETDVLRIANSAHDGIDKFPSGTPQVAQIEKRIKVQSTVTRVDAGHQVSGGGKAVAKKAVGPREIFKPLKGSRVEIKDEIKDEKEEE